MTDTLAPLRHAPFRYLALGRVVSMLGSSIAPIALSFAVLDLTGSVRDLGLVVASRSLANVAFLLFGGVVADRLPRQLMIVVSSVLSGLTQGAVAVLVMTHAATVPLLMALGAVNGVVGAFAFPATSALIPQTVPREIRKEANALNRFGVNAASIVGASVGGLLVASIGSGWSLAVDAATYLLGAVLFTFVRVPARRAADAGQATSVVRELREGWREFVSHTWVWVVVLGFCFFNAAFSSAVGVLGPPIADHTFGRPAWGYILGVETLGMLAGGLVAMRLRVRRLLLLGVAACVVPVPMLLALALAPTVAVLLPLAFVSGVAVEQFGIAWETSVQEHVPEEKLARVYSYDALGSFVAIPVGQVVIGPLALAVGNRAAVTIAAGVALLSVIGMLASRSVRTLRHDPAPRPADPEPVAEVSS